jgi:hypothetical protein
MGESGLAALGTKAGGAFGRNEFIEPIQRLAA